MSVDPLDVQTTFVLEQGVDPCEIKARILALYDASRRRGLGLEGFVRAIHLVDGVAEVRISGACRADLEKLYDAAPRP